MNSHGKNRHSHAVIDLQALRENHRILREAAGSSRFIAVVKADAYGHGAVEVARTLGEEVDAFAVAAVAEAVALRTAGITGKIIVMGGFIRARELQTCIEYALDPVLHHQFHLDCLADSPNLADLDVWLKIDTGMGRLGFPLSQTADVIASLQSLNTLGNLRLMTHLANADSLDDPFTDFQLNQIKSLGLDNFEWGIANSAGILGWSGSHHTWVRAGIALYGADPMSDRRENTRALKPVMTMKSRVLAVNHHHEGDMIGYAHTYTCDRDMNIAVVATGYADGFPRHKRATARVSIRGSLCDVVGRVSMDMITVDVSHLSEVRLDEEVTLFGVTPSVNELADCSQTIAYEILCNVGAHVRREYEN